jgi:hypothetical protein
VEEDMEAGCMEKMRETAGRRWPSLCEVTLRHSAFEKNKSGKDQIQGTHMSKFQVCLGQRIRRHLCRFAAQHRAR